MESAPAELVLDARATLGEGPCWDERRSLLIWVDIEGCQVHQFDPATGADRAIDVGEHVGVCVPTDRGDYLAAGANGFFRLDPETGAKTKLFDPEAHLPRNRFNDGKCDPAGRFWAGTMSYDKVVGAGSVYRLEPNGTLSRRIESVTTSNGLAWSLDGRTLYYIDSPTRRVDAFDFDPATGELANRRAAIVVPDERGKPDGMTIDAEGMLWVCLWGGSAAVRWNPTTGELLSRIDVPASQTTSCAFGGPGYGTLFITSARTGLSSERLAAEPLAGGLFRFTPPVPGLPPHRFGG